MYLFNVFTKKIRLDILVNNAGTFSASNNIEDIEEEDFDYIIRMNLKAPFILSKFAIKHIKKQNSGKIIYVSSIGENMVDILIQPPILFLKPL